MPPVLSIALLFAGLLALLYALGRLAARPANIGGRAQYTAALLACIYLALAAMLLHAAALVSGALAYAPHALGWYLPGLLAIGPLLLRFLRVRLGLADRTQAWRAHLIPAGLSLLGLLGFSFVDAHTKLTLIQNLRTGALDWFHTACAIYAAVVALSSLHPIIYAVTGIAQLVRTAGWRTHQSARTEATEVPGATKWLLIFLLVALGLLSLLLLMGFVARSQALITFAAVLGVLLIASLYLLERRYPFFWDEVEAILERGKYQSSQLNGKDLADIERRLSELMNREELYRDEQLSLAALADRLQLSRHQLSEYFNVQLGLNFSRYVNQHRVRAACELLVTQPELTVLNVAYEVGFNTKSVFNTAFARETGRSPTAYRKEHRFFRSD